MSQRKLRMGCGESLVRISIFEQAPRSLSETIALGRGRNCKDKSNPQGSQESREKRKS